MHLRSLLAALTLLAAPGLAHAGEGPAPAVPAERPVGLIGDLHAHLTTGSAYGTGITLGARVRWLELGVFGRLSGSDHKGILALAGGGFVGASLPLGERVRLDLRGVAMHREYSWSTGQGGAEDVGDFIVSSLFTCPPPSTVSDGTAALGLHAGPSIRIGRNVRLGLLATYERDLRPITLGYPGHVCSGVQGSYPADARSVAQDRVGVMLRLAFDVPL